MSNPLFSTYRGGENRVTSSTIAVFQRIDLGVVKELLQNAAGMGEELRAVSFENQVVGDGSVPDARISAHFTWWFETKTVSQAYQAEGHDRTQVRAHAARLVGDADAYLFVLTPDATQPAWLSAPDGIDATVRDRIVWLSFAALAAAIREIIGDATRRIGEQTRFLLNELVSLYEADGLLSSDDTVIVAARTAWGEYQRHGVYICQPDRAFRNDLTHFGFYAHGQIKPAIARIRRRVPAIVFSSESAAACRDRGDEHLATVIEDFLSRGARDEGASYGVFLLSSPDDADTVTLSAPIVNDTVASTGRSWAWTMGQRYTSLAKLTSGVTRTSQL
ncbi:hypothetical protein [Microbacterium sp. NPDC056736]|uniref:hypothetical protein n=1 Tax=Microbacterium sp. NPDC056736 TaxID=3345932 RepID=UPI00366DC65B